MKKIYGFIRLTRPINCLMMGFAVVVGAAIAAQMPVVEHDAFKLLLGFITASTLTGASMAINDYYDREIDAINEPDRPIPSGLVKPTESIILSAFLASTGLIAAVLTNPLSLLIATLSLIISVSYSTFGKISGLPGNFMVSLCISLPFIYGGVALKGFIEPKTILFAILAFLANTGREITKGIADIEGDKVKGIKTLAISHGPKKAAQVALTFFILAVILSPLPIILGLVNILFIPPLIIADAGFIMSSISLIKDYTRKNAKKIKSTVLLWMIMGLIAFITGTMN